MKVSLFLSMMHLGLLLLPPLQGASPQQYVTDAYLYTKAGLFKAGLR